MNSHQLQKEMMDVIFDSKAGGAPVTVEWDDGYRNVIGFVWCQGCEQFHITVDDKPV